MCLDFQCELNKEFKMKRALLMFLFSVLCLIAGNRQAWASMYDFSVIQVPYSNGTGTDAYGINNSGEMVGGYGTTSSGLGFGWADSGGNFSQIIVPGTNYTLASGVNSSGTIAGSSYIGGAPWNGFVDSNGVYTKIDSTQTGAVSTLVNGINNAGALVGEITYNSTLSGPHTGFLDVGGVFTTIQPLGAISSDAEGINKSGEIVGGFTDSSGVSYGFLYAGGKYTTIDVPGSSSTNAVGINNAGEIVGSATFGSTTDGFLFTGTSYITFSSPVSGYADFFLDGINSLGQVVGYAGSPGISVAILGDPISATPENGSLVLFGTAIIALTAYQMRNRLMALVKF